MEKEVNIMLTKFKDQIGIDDVSSEENKQKLKNFLENNEEMIKDIFDKADEETRREIKELYILIQE